MSTNISLQSHRPSPPESPPVDVKQTFITMNNNTNLPNTPQSPPLASGTNLTDTLHTAIEMDIETIKTQLGLSSEPAEASNKRKRDTDDDGDRQELKKVHIENHTPGIEVLHRDVGPPYRISSTPYPKEPIDTTIDLFKVYSLEGLAQHVSRGGDNPKKMGKTYKKHMRVMKLSGKFDAVKKQDNELGLFDMLHMPDEMWNETQTMGRNLQDGLRAEVRLNLAQAMSMSKGAIPKPQFDPSPLALDALPLSVAPTLKPVPIASAANRKSPGSTTSTPAQSRLSKAAADQIRPQRNIKKRVYTDEGFEGYGEGYADDMADDGAFRVGDEDRQQHRKKVRSWLDQVHQTPLTDVSQQQTTPTGYHYPPTTMRHASSYGVGA